MALHEVKIFDANGKLRKVIAPKDLSINYSPGKKTGKGYRKTPEHCDAGDPGGIDTNLPKDVDYVSQGIGVDQEIEKLF